MGKPSAKPMMMRFEPKSGWSEAAADIISINDRVRMDGKPDAPLDPISTVSGQANFAQAVDNLPTEALMEIGESMQEVFDSLKISDPRLQAWTQVHAAIRLISGKLDERKSLQERITALDTEIEGVRMLAAELVATAYRSEQEIHETSKLRMQIAESLSEKLASALKG
jgi:DNA repair ATPase RecN